MSQFSMNPYGLKAGEVSSGVSILSAPSMFQRSFAFDIATFVKYITYLLLLKSSSTDNEKLHSYNNEEQLYSVLFVDSLLIFIQRSSMFFNRHPDFHYAK